MAARAPWFQLPARVPTLITGTGKTPPPPAPPPSLSTPGALRSGRSTKSQAKRGLYFYTVFELAVLSGREPEQGDEGERGAL